MESKKNAPLVLVAKQLRKAMTPQERHLWYDFLSTYPVRFYRQKILGNYIVDFYCAKAKLVIELDGSQHFGVVAAQKDAQRTAILEQYGLRVLRIPNNQVDNAFSSVCQYIDLEVKRALGLED